MKPTPMKTETFNLLVCDEITAALMRRIQEVEKQNAVLLQRIRSSTGDLRTIRRDVGFTRRQMAKLVKGMAA